MMLISPGSHSSSHPNLNNLRPHSSQEKAAGGAMVFFVYMSLTTVQESQVPGTFLQSISLNLPSPTLQLRKLNPREVM